MANVLIIDDDQGVCRMLSGMIHGMGHNALYEQNLNNGLDKALENPFDIVFLDVRMTEGNGLDILPRIKETDSSPEVIIITGYGDADSA